MEIQPSEFISFFDWLGPALLFFAKAVPLLALAAFFACYLMSAIRHGPVEAFYVVARVIATAITRDLPGMSLRRTWAIARFAMQEAIRRKVLVVVAIFAVLMLFAGWFLDTRSDDPAHIYLTFVMRTTQLLMLILALFLSCFSLPNDIKNKTIYTIVTKPVRAGEIVLGRMIGFSAIGSILLLGICLVSYIFVVRGLDHQHDVAAGDIQVVGQGDKQRLKGATTDTLGHSHDFDSGGGTSVVERALGHTHTITTSGVSEDATFSVGAPQGMLEARIPIYGDLKFTDREGNPSDKGTNVGKEWEYRSYIEGRTLATAMWTFEDIEPQNFENGLPLAMTLTVFRTHKGDIVTPVRGILILVNPDPTQTIKQQSEPIGFESDEFATKVITVPSKLKAIGGRDITLNDLVHEGKLEVWVRCDDRAQYFGMAQGDLYVMAGNASFFVNFVKGYAGIWLQMVMVTCFGVMFSTFLHSAVAMLATVISIVLGRAASFIEEIWLGEMPGGGPIEATIRLVEQYNLVNALDLGVVPTMIMKWADYVLVTFLYVLCQIMPNYKRIDRMTDYVVYNFNVLGDLLARHCVVTLTYALGLAVIGYFFLKTREIAA